MADQYTGFTDRPPGRRPAPRGTAAYSRKRAMTTCQVCRSRRTKCDNLKPSCSFCLKIGARCIQSPIDLSSFDPASLRILERLDELEHVVRDVGVSAPTRVEDSSLSLTPSANPVIDKSWQLPWSLERLLPQLGSHIAQPALMTILRQSTSATTAVSPQSPLSVVADFDQRTVKALLDAFFSFVHVKNPILQEDATRRLVLNICLHGVDWSAQSCLALLVCALGAVGTPFGDSTNVSPGSSAYMQSQAYFTAAQKRLGTCMSSGAFIDAQCLFLAGVYLMHTFQPIDAWRLFNQSLACCQTFDFLAKPSTRAEDADLPDFFHYSSEEQAIYWSAWKSEQELRFALEPHDYIARDVSQSLYPSFFPTPPLPSDTNAYRNQDSEQREQLSWYFYLTEISLRRLSSRMTYDMLNTAPWQETSILQSLADALPSREAEVASWVAALPAPMSLDSPEEYDDICKFVIRGHLMNMYEMLYWPFLVPSLDRPDGLVAAASLQEAYENRIGFKMLAEAALQKHVDRIWLNRPGFKHRHHGTWPLIRACSRSAVVLIKAASRRGRSLTSDAEILMMPDHWQEAVHEVIKLNQYWQTESADACHHLPLMEQAFAELETS